MDAVGLCLHYVVKKLMTRGVEAWRGWTLAVRQISDLRVAGRSWMLGLHVLSMSFVTVGALCVPDSRWSLGADWLVQAHSVRRNQASHVS